MRRAAWCAGAMLVGLMLACAGKGGGGGAAGPERGEPVAEVDAAALLNAYSAALSADKQYTGKTILLTGMVRSSERTPKGALVRVGDFEGNEIDCYFRSEAEVSGLKQRDGVKVIGVCKGTNGRRGVDMVDCGIRR